jgi:hypothetical protein
LFFIASLLTPHFFFYSRDARRCFYFYFWRLACAITFFQTTTHQLPSLPTTTSVSSIDLCGSAAWSVLLALPIPTYLRFSQVTETTTTTTTTTSLGLGSTTTLSAIESPLRPPSSSPPPFLTSLTLAAPFNPFFLFCFFLVTPAPRSYSLFSQFFLIHGLKQNHFLSL